MEQKILDNYTQYIIIAIWKSGSWNKVDSYLDYDRAKSMLDSIVNDENISGYGEIEYRLIKQTPEFIV